MLLASRLLHKVFTTVSVEELTLMIRTGMAHTRVRISTSLPLLSLEENKRSHAASCEGLFFRGCLRSEAEVEQVVFAHR
jgi:hypothetical protein